MILNAPLRAWAKFTVILVGCGFSLVSVWRTPGQELRQVSEAPLFGTFWLLSFELDGGQSPPYPFDPYDGTLPIYQMDGFPNHYLVTDSPEDYSALRERRTVKAHGEMNTLDGGEGPPVPGEGGGGGNGTNSPPVYVLGLGLCLYPPILTSSNSLILIITNTPDSGWLTNAHDLFYTTNMASLPAPVLCATNWAYWGRNQPGETNFTFSPLPYPECYFRLGTMQDGDFDGLTTAFERLVSHTSETNADCPRDVYEGVVSNQTPSAWFKLNDGSLTNAISGQAVTTLTNGGGLWDPDAFAIGNSAYSFSQTSDKLVVTNDAIGGGTGDATNQGSFTLLFKAMARQATAKRYVLSQGTRTSTTSGEAIAVYFDGTGTNGALRVGVGPNEAIILQDSNIVRGAWYYLAVTCDETRASNEVRWYLGHVGSQTLQSNSFSLGQAKKFGTNGPITLGNKEGNGSTSAFRESPTINGSIDQAAFWKREVTEAEVNAQFNTLNALFLGPSKVFDLTRWNLLLPVDKLNQLGPTNAALEISTGWLNSGFKYVDPTDWTQKYFYLSTNNTMVFEAPWNGARSSGGSGARSELRETKADGSPYNWLPLGTNTLEATCAVHSAGTNNDRKVIIGQIHSETASNPPVVISYNFPSNKNVTATFKSSPNGSADNNLLLATNVNVLDQIHYQAQLTDDGTNLNLHVEASVNGVPQTALDQQNRPLALSPTDAWRTNTFYFKAGCYYPTNGAGSPIAGTAKVTFSSLTATNQP